MKIGGNDRLILAAVSAKKTEWSSPHWPSSASMFCSPAGRGPIRNIRLSPKYRQTSDCGPSGSASSRGWDCCASSVMGNSVTDSALCTKPEQCDAGRTWLELRAYPRQPLLSKNLGSAGEWHEQAPKPARPTLFVRRNSQLDDACRRADAIHAAGRRASQLSAPDVRGHPPPGGGRPVEPQAVPSEDALPPGPIVGGRRQVRHRLPRAPLGAGQPR